MTTSDWITIVCLFATSLGSTLLLAFKIGGVHEKVVSMEKSLERVTLTLEKITSGKKFRAWK